jgi:hypothetical protein
LILLFSLFLIVSFLDEKIFSVLVSLGMAGMIATGAFYLELLFALLEWRKTIPVFTTKVVSEVVTIVLVLYMVSCDLMRLLFFIITVMKYPSL